VTIARVHVAPSEAKTYATHTRDLPIKTASIDTSLTIVRGLVELLLQDLPCDPQGVGAALVDALNHLEEQISTVVRRDLHKKTMLSA
jgi:hypothetical protein